MIKINIKFKQILKMLFWESKKRFYSLRYPLFFLIGLLLIIFILPPNTCQYLDKNFSMLLDSVSALLIALFFFAFVLLPYYHLTVPYGSDEYSKEIASNISIKTRLFTRIFVNFFLNILVLLLAYIAQAAMDKFSYSGTTYFFIELNGDFKYTLLIFFLFSPIIYLAIFLRRYIKYQNRNFFISFLFAEILSTILFASVGEIVTSYSETHLIFINFILITSILILTYLIFLRCCRYEEQI